MPAYAASSRCSSGSPVTLRWFGTPACAVGDDFETAEAVLFASVSREGRVWNPYSSAITRAEFRKRLRKAAAGELEPVDEVKPIDVANPPPLYEIRWQGITVAERAADGQVSHHTALVRLYHSEPPQVPTHFVAHHAHEKVLDVDDINAAQQVEIRTAISHHDRGVPSTWGIAESASSL